MIKPYATKVGRKWIVLNAQGREAFSTEVKELAFLYLERNWTALRAVL